MMLIAIILVLFAGGLVAWLVEAWNPDWPKWVSLIALVIAGLLFLPFLNTTGGDEWLLMASYPWIPRFGITFLVGMDGLSLLLVGLTLVLGVIALASSWTEIDYRPGFFQFNLMFTLAGVVGVFVALDLFLFFVFWEVMIIPMYFLIAIWGHENRSYAAMKFFLFTQISGLLMLLSIVALVMINTAAGNELTFNYFDLLEASFSDEVGLYLMLGFFVAFVVKLPGFPFHTWLPDAHTQAPTAASVLLAGILLKTGAYGLIRFTVPLFPAAAGQIAELAMILGAIGIIYGAVLAFAQTDFKRLVAYSSVSHMGFVLIGVYAWNELALQGAVMQMIAHGFSTAALFMLAGALQHRLHTRDMTKMGGLWHDAPRMGAIALFFIVASLGMPGLGNFVGEFLILLGTFAVNIPVTVAAALGLVTAAVYSLIAMQKVFHGPAAPGRHIHDFDAREISAMTVMMAGLLLLGLYPQPVFDLLDPSLSSLNSLVGGTRWIGVGQ